MASRKPSSAGKGALDGFKAVDAIPPATRSSWAVRAIEQFLEGNDKIVACEYDQEKTAVSKQAALNKAAKRAPFDGKLKVHRRGKTIYLEKI